MPMCEISTADGIISSMQRRPEKLVDSMTSILPPPSIPIYKITIALLSSITSEIQPK